MMCQDTINGKLFKETHGCYRASKLIVRHARSRVEGEATFKFFLAMLINSWYLEQCSRTMESGRPSDWAEYGESSTVFPGQAKTPFGPETKTLEQEVVLQ
jgi:hypothetical protein